VDDVLDYMADASALGKPLGGDLREGKVTLPVILLLQKRPDVAPIIQSVIAEGEVQPETWRMIQDLLRHEGAVDAAFERAVGFASRAKQHMLDAFPPSTEREGLIALADYVVSRDR
jgi:octaprenyl-diphosphate synthase